MTDIPHLLMCATPGNQTSVDANGCESYSNMMPFLLRVPALARTTCACPHYSMLGFGDVALPGFAVALTLRADCALAINGRRARTFVGRYSYFITTLTAYVVGLLCAFYAAEKMSMAQPALLCVIPYNLSHYPCSLFLYIFLHTCFVYQFR
jgi:hypothetical protein